MLIFIAYLVQLIAVVSANIRPGQPGERLHGLPNYRFVRKVDEGVHYGVIHPYVQEWNDTIKPYERIGGYDPKAAMAPHAHGTPVSGPWPLHMFFRCFDNVLRIYFSFESLGDKPNPRNPEGSET